MDKAATHLGGGALPTSKVWSDLQISPDAHGFPVLSGPKETPEPAPSALKEQQGFGHSILHGASGTRTVLSQRSDLVIDYAIARRTTHDPGKQCAA